MKHTKTNDASGYRHHPEHAIDGHAMRGGSENAPEDDYESREDDGGFPAEVVAGQTNWFSSQTVQTLYSRCS